MKQDTVVFVADSHGNSLTGLCPLLVKLEDRIQIANDGQALMWTHWMDFWDRVEAKPGTKTVVLDGDIVDLNPKACQLISTNPVDAVRIATVSYERPRKIAQRLFTIRGTAFHSGKAGWLEETFAKEMDSIKCDDDKFSWWHLKLRIQGKLFDICHHGTIGGLPWTTMNPLNRTAYEIAARCEKTKEPKPDYVIRAHTHTKGDSHDAHPSIRVISLPCWQAKDSYGYKVAANKITQFGGMIITITDGVASEPEFILYEPKEDEIWSDERE
jgi:hypothetical protein